VTAWQRPPVEPQGEPPSAQLQTLPGLRPRPQPHQYPDYQVYEDDLLNWRDEARAAEAAVRQRADADWQVQTQWAQRTEDGRLRYRDYDRQMGAMRIAVTAGSVLAPFFVESEAGADIMYHLATHADEITAFNGMPPGGAAP